MHTLVAILTIKDLTNRIIAQIIDQRCEIKRKGWAQHFLLGASLV
jgi:hypothetical protein